MCGHVVQRAAVKLLHADCNNLMVRAAGSITGSRWWPPTSGERFTSFQIFLESQNIFSCKMQIYLFLCVAQGAVDAGQGSDLPAQGRVQAGALLGGGRGQRAGTGGGEPAEEGGAARAQPPLPPAAQAVHQVWYSRRLL